MASVLYFGFFGQEPCGILALQTRIELTPSALEGEVFTIGLRGKSQQTFLKSVGIPGRTFQLHS